LAVIAGDERAFEELVREIEQLNPGVAAMLTAEEEDIAYWEEDLFEGAG
jgi:UV DNA damage repair endonuclease